MSFRMFLAPFRSCVHTPVTIGGVVDWLLSGLVGCQIVGILLTAVSTIARAIGDRIVYDSAWEADSSPLATSVA